MRNYSRRATLTSIQDKNNKGDNGFFPCPKDIIELTMKLIKFNLPIGTKINCSDFVGGLGDQLYTIHKGLMEQGLEPISFYNEMQTKRYKVAVEKYGNIENFNTLNADFFHMKLVGRKGNRERSDILPLIYANPPYFDMVDEFDNTKIKRSEDVFFSDLHEFNCTGGVLLFVVRQPQLASQVELMRKITYRYENISIFKFPTMQELADTKGLSKTAYINNLANEMGINNSKLTDFDQIVVIGQKKRRFFNDKETADLWIEKLKSDSIQTITEYILCDGKPVVEINEEVIKYQLDYEIFRDRRVCDETLSNGLNDVLDEILDAVYYEQTNVGITAIKSKPIIEKTPGNVTNTILAGGEDGLIGGLLIKGSTIKTITTLTDEDEENNETITTEIETLSPCISALNNQGDSYYQSYLKNGV